VTAFRLAAGGRIDRDRPLRFTFDGRPVEGLAGDTIASALLANGVSVVNRSFKYHRPRGVWGMGFEDPNALVDASGPRVLVNGLATMEPAVEGLSVRGVNGRPTVAADRARFIDLFSAFMPSGFYYKTFMLPNWHLYEPSVRAMGGFGVLDPKAPLPERADQVNASVDVLVVGAGPAGLLAARLAAEAGRSVLVCDAAGEAGGSLLARTAEIDGLSGPAWVADALARLEALQARLLVRTTAFGLYDHGLVGLVERGADGGADRLWRVRPGHVILAAGAIERPLPFANNDLPGIMSAEAGLHYLRRHAIAPGRKVVVATNNGLAFECAAALAAEGIAVTVVDAREGARGRPEGVPLLAGRTIVAAEGRGAVRGVRLDDGSRLTADAVLVSGGFSPTLHLHCQGRGKLAWNEALAAFLPAAPIEGMSVVGAAAGLFLLPQALDSVRAALDALGIQPGVRPTLLTPPTDYAIAPVWPEPRAKGRVWLDMQHDVTTKDVELAVREAYVSVEHLKRYTALGMAGDQGKTSNVPGLALLSALTGRPIPDVGTTTFRPPFSPLPLGALAGTRGGVLMNPPRRLVLENLHREAGASLREYGGWLRPAHYGHGTEAGAIAEEARTARESVALFDGSPLGKIEVIGPDAQAFVDFIYCNRMSTLKPGHCRYGLMLAESGVVYDDGVLVRLDEDRFLVSCSSSHVLGVHTHLETWRQDRFDRNRVFIHNATAANATLTVSGPKSRALLEAVGLGLPLDDDSLPHMAFAEGAFEGEPVRLTRVSFTGDRSYEISIRSDRAAPLWQRLRSVGRDFGLGLLGLEALMLLRAEKGYVVIGKDSDGLTLPADLGFGAAVAAKPGEFVGRRSLALEEGRRAGRKELVGLEVADGGPPLQTGAHVVTGEGQAVLSLGYVTSSYLSPTLQRPIALGLVEAGRSRIGDSVDILHLGARRRARLAPLAAFDPKGERLHG
jgi:sarcosine oxidase subunit alpha